MKIAVGYAFTDAPLIALKAKGFSAQVNDYSELEGYKSCLFLAFDSLKTQSDSLAGFEIREIIDEKKYADHFGIEDFEPHLEKFENTTEAKSVAHQNTIIHTEHLLHLINDVNQIGEGEFYQFLKLRKQFPLAVLTMHCHNYEEFVRVAKPDKEFMWKTIPGALLHLGPNCFDIFIYENKPGTHKT